MHKQSHLVMCTNPMYIERLLKFSNIEHEMHGQLFTQPGFAAHNHLVQINSIFSSQPKFDLVDRTQTVHQPLKYYVDRAWTVPTAAMSLDQAMQSRVEDILAEHELVNIFWSGGIDSTAVVTAFLKYCSDLQRIRIFYSPWSTYEHPEFLTFVKQWPNIELVDLSGDVYMNCQFDGAFVTGDGGDEINASIDSSFLSTHGTDVMACNWQDFFYQQHNNEEFIEFCRDYFALSGRPIESVLEARWWFYTSCKMTGIFYNLKLPYFTSAYENFNHKRLISFFNCHQLESFAYFNIDKIMPTDDYITWKQYLKDFCYSNDGLSNWHQTHRKINSGQIVDYTFKKVILSDSRYLMILSDGSVVRTPNLPFFSARELHHHCQHQLESVFNDPN